MLRRSLATAAAPRLHERAAAVPQTTAAACRLFSASAGPGSPDAPSPAKLPAHARTLIIGGGIIGNSVAYHLSKKASKIAQDIVLLEQHQLTSGTTWHAAGLVGCLRGTSNETQLSKVGQSLYRTLLEETGVDAGYKRCGSLTLARGPERMQALQLAEQRCRAFGVPGRLVGAEEAVDLLTHEGVPLISGEKLAGALVLPMDGSGSPTDTTLALAAGARQRGVSIVEGARVEEILVDRAAAGLGGCFLDGDFGRRRAVGVRVRLAGGEKDAGGATSHTITCDNLVLCAGQWTRQLAATIDVNVPLHSAEHYYIITKGKFPGSHPDLPIVRDPDAYIYLREWSEGLCIGGFEPKATPIWTEGVPQDFEFGMLPDNWESFDILLQGALERLPALQDSEIRTFFNGPESFTIDNQYILGEAPEVRKLFVAAGFNSSGIASAGGAGSALADWIEAGEPTMDLTALDIRRFGKFQGNRDFLRERTAETLGLHYSMPWPRLELQTARGQRVSPLYGELLGRGARFGQKFGWERANWFAGSGAPAGAEPRYTFGAERPEWWAAVASEVQHTRSECSLMDMTSFVKLEVRGHHAGTALDWLCTSDIANMPVDSTRYTQMLNRRGGVEADVTVARLASDSFMVVGPTAAGTLLPDWMRRGLEERPCSGADARDLAHGLQIRDVSGRFAVLAVMGPRAREVLEVASRHNYAWRASADGSSGVREHVPASEFWSNEAFPFGASRWIDIGNTNGVRAQRITYVGELGYELYVPAEAARSVYRALHAAGAAVGGGVRDAGYYAIEALRLEKGYRAFGHEVGPDDSLIEAGLGFTVAWDKGAFLGRGAVAAKKAEVALAAGGAAGADPHRRRLLQLVAELPNREGASFKERDLVLPWGGEPVYVRGDGADTLVGRATSSVYGFSLDKAVFMAYVEHPDVWRKGWATGADFAVELFGQRYAARGFLPNRPAYDPSGLKIRGASS